MKFLCVPCDQPMKLGEVGPPDRGSLAVRYACPACGYEMAMLTNPFETQMVQSLGVKIGPDVSAAEPKTEGASKCPFAGMIPGLSDAAKDGAAEAGDPEAAAVPWTTQAEARLEMIPSFVRPMARTGIERFARERGYATVDEKVLDEARDFFGM
jgi:hypothetical protein